ncbi:hypothetical protein [Candidatus Parabeggiatoa sp. HSG14]|nr:hypothetical protein [Thiotrichales bacterium HSG14]
MEDSNSLCPATYAVETGTLSIPYIDVPTDIAVGNKELMLRTVLPKVNK